MLDAMRNGAHSKIISTFLFGLLMLAAGGMAFMDVGGFFRNGTVGNNIAKIGREEISAQAFDNTVQRIARAQGMTAKQAYQYGLTGQILQQDINSRLLSQGAMKNDIYVGDAQVAEQINQMLAPALKGQPGADRHAVLQTLLRNQNMGEAELIGTIRNSMMSTILQAAIQSGTTTPPRQEALDIYRVQNESRTVQGFILTNESVKGVEDAKEETLKALYEAAKGAKYSIPETRKFTMAILGEDNVRASLKISDEDLKKEYDKNSVSYTAPEHRVVQQAVLDKEESAAKVVAAIKGGKGLKDAVQAVTSSSTAYLGEDNFVKAGLPKPVADATFDAKADQAVGPVKTPLGYHVLVVKKIIAPEVKSFESVREDLRKGLIQEKMGQQMQTTANTVDDRLAGGEDINKIAQELGLKVETIGPVGNGGATSDKHDALKDYGKDRAYILKTAFEMNEGETAPVLQLGDGRYAAIHMDKVDPLSFRPYEDVRAEIKKDWLAEQQASLNHDRAVRVQQDIAGGNKPLAAAASENGFSVVTFSGLKRTTPQPAIGEEAMSYIFDAVKGETISSPVPNGYLIGTVTSVDTPDPAKVSDADLKPVIEQLKKQSGQDVMMAYVRHLQDKLGVKVNRELLDRMYGLESGTTAE
ncbi:MAG: Peptidyl-prolyl cis-trans isomerase ppiD [Micavibrio sp.]|nr:Peptidyl-prolyl cis-trans isomerase ppiD [Micavibrio sp.]